VISGGTQLLKQNLQEIMKLTATMFIIYKIKCFRSWRETTWEP